MTLHSRIKRRSLIMLNYMLSARTLSRRCLLTTGTITVTVKKIPLVARSSPSPFPLPSLFIQQRGFAKKKKQNSASSSDAIPSPSQSPSPDDFIEEDFDENSLDFYQNQYNNNNDDDDEDEEPVQLPTKLEVEAKVSERALMKTSIRRAYSR